MAAPSNLSLRSSRRNNKPTDLAGPATIGTRTTTRGRPPLPPPPSHPPRRSPSPPAAKLSLGKRTRGDSQTNGVLKPSKRHKAEVQFTSRLKLATTEEDHPQKQQHFTHNSSPAHHHSLPRETRGGRVTTAVQPPADGTIIANSVSQTESTNGDVLVTGAATQGYAGLQPKGNGDADKRTLRSQDGGSRSKSELSLYFPNYEDLISKEPRETELLSAETRLFITEDPPKSPIATQTFILPSPIETSPNTGQSSPISPKIPLSSLTDSQRLDFSDVLKKIPRNGPDPLPSSLFHKAHRRAERQEKQLRNIEKERAQHEKVQLERLYDGLRGPDWLRVMGISGVTEGERKTWEGRRAWCIREVRALLEKFRAWKEEERRRKLEKEMSHADDEASDGEDEDEDEDEDESEATDQEEEEDDKDEDDDPKPRKRSKAAVGRSDQRRRIRRASSSDVDALAALQLHNETLSASAQKLKQKPRGKPGPKPKPKPPPDEQPRQRGGGGGGRGRGGRLNPATTMSATSSLAMRPHHRSNPSISSTTHSYQPRRSSLLTPLFTGGPSSSYHEVALEAENLGPLTSFFKKPHQRAAALDRNRRSGGRMQFAFGQPIPEMEEEPFELPRGWLTEDARKAAARARRSKRRKGRDE